MTNPGAGGRSPAPGIDQRVLLAIPTGPFEGSYVTKILEARDGGFKIYAPSFRGTILPIPPGARLQVHFTRDDAHYEYECEIVERYPGPIPTVLISPPAGNVRRVQRRGFYRLGAEIPVAIEPISPLAGTPPPGPPGRGTTVNLSGGGVLIESPELYPEGALLDLTLEIPDGSEAATLRSEVLRDAGRASPGVRATWFLAVEFLEVPDEVQDRITRYIYLLQRAIREERPGPEGEGA